VIQTKIEAKEDQDACGCGLCDSAIGMHRGVDPIAIAKIPDKSGAISECGSLNWSNRTTGLILGGKRE
jgi:hypothetical protein